MNDDQEVTIEFEGRRITCASGMSLAAALTEAGELALRESGDAESRGIFCGIGVCQECRLQVDGRNGVRACMTVVKPAMRVSRQPCLSPTSVSGETASSGDESAIEEPDILIVGAGAAGLTAASVAAEGGAKVVVLDERPKAGGQFYKQPLSAEQIPASLANDPQFSDGRLLIERAQRAGATVVAAAEVWAAFAPKEFAVFDGNATRLYRPRRAIVATGAFERGLPLPGWTLPGVMTTGAAQTLLRSYGVVAGKRILIAGNGPLNLQVGLELKRAGADVVAITELALKPGVGNLLAVLRMVLSAPDITAKGRRILSQLANLDVPVLFGQGLAAVQATDGGLRAVIGAASDAGISVNSNFDVDIVCMGYGFQPNNEILRCLGCRHSFDNARGYLVTERDEQFRTTVDGVYAVGDCCGLGGAPAATDEATIAAADALSSLDLALSPPLQQQQQLARKSLRRQRAFQSALWQLFDAPLYQANLAAADTPVCRCENVSRAALEAALAEGNVSIGTLKRQTRLGMGPCQGRYCAPVAAAMIAERDGKPPDEFSLFAPRVPLKPMRIADIIGPAAD